MISKIFKKIVEHKFITGVVLLLIASGGYFGYQNLTKDKKEVQYAVAAVERGTLTVSTTGSGQVSVSNQVDIKPKVPGDVAYIGVQDGQEVEAGTLLIKLDSRDAQKAVRDAELALALAQAKENAEDSREEAYVSAFNTIADAFADLPTIITGLNDVLHSSSYLSDELMGNYDRLTKEYRYDAMQKYDLARAKYDPNLKDYKVLNRDSEASTLESVLNETYETLKATSEAVKDANTVVDYVADQIDPEDWPTSLSRDQVSLDTYAKEVNSHLLAILTIQHTIKNLEVDKQTKELTLKQQENALLDAKEAFDDYSIRAPFDGIVTNFTLQKGESVSSNTVIASLISKQKIAEVILNETDVAKVKIGQKANLTFDAIQDLNISGEVVEINTLGTVTQGVVTYGAKIAFDTQDERVKPQMSLSASIITEVKQNVFLVPNSAIKQQDGMPYVELAKEVTAESSKIAANVSGLLPASTLQIQSVQVQTGISNDTMTEVTNGLKEGDLVVTETIDSSSVKNQTEQRRSGPSGGIMMPFGGR